jgi:hypothetical protein
MVSSIDLEKRTCGCGITFRVLPTSSQHTCGRSCCTGKKRNEFSPHVKPKAKTAKEAREKFDNLKDDLAAAGVPAVVMPNSVTIMDKMDALQTWADCVQAAKMCVVRIEQYRMVIASLCIKACDIKHGGGGHWNGFADQKTIVNFAAEIGINKKTLSEWVAVKRDVINKLPPKERAIAAHPKNYARVRMVKDRITKKTPKSEVLRRFRNVHPDGANDALIRLKKAGKYIRDIATWMKKKSVRDQAELEDLERILKAAQDIQGYLTHYVSVRRDKKLMKDAK